MLLINPFRGPFIIILLINLVAFEATAKETNSNDNPIEPRGQDDRAQQLELPKIFDFQEFLRAFGKHYTDAVELLLRQKYFLARACRAFLSAVAYKLRRQSSYLAINSRSDWSPLELEATLMHEKDSSEWLPSDEEEFEPQVDLEELKKHLQEIRSKQNAKPEFAVLVRELQLLERLKRSKRSPNEIARSNGNGNFGLEGKQQRNDFDISGALLRKRGLRRTSSIKTTVGKIKSNNPNYQPPELVSFGRFSRSERDFHNHPEYRPVYYRWSMEGVRNLALKESTKTSRSQNGKSFLDKIVGSFVEGLNDMFGEDRNSGKIMNQVDHTKQTLADEVFIDHRRSGCMFEAQEQGACGSCYAFATIAFLEWAHCMSTGALEKFSEQYVVDCGRRAGGIKGCRSGKITSMAEFVNNFGLELERHYPYVAREDECPYEADTSFEAMGYLRVPLGFVLRVPLELMEHYLQSTPMVVSLAVGHDFYEYGGGVDSGRGCGSKGKHSMLLMGHGRQDGREYWLLRNSYSTDFGEQGYYKLDKLTGSRCFDPDEGFVYGRDEHHRGAPSLFSTRNTRLTEPVKKIAQQVATKRSALMNQKELEAAEARDEARRLRAKNASQ